MADPKHGSVQVEITIVTFDVEEDPSCEFDFIQIFDGSSCEYKLPF